jgi:hypothetical protein
VPASGLGVGHPCLAARMRIRLVEACSSLAFDLED